jgi:hypothetical protein
VRSAITSETLRLHCDGFGAPPNVMRKATSNMPAVQVLDLTAVLAWRCTLQYAHLQSTFVISSRSSGNCRRSLQV